MNDLPISSLRALPDGNAELRVVLTLSWNDVASLGREAGRLATHLQRAVSLDEAASHALSARAESAALARPRGNPALEQPAAAVAPQVEQARQSAELMMRPAASTAPANGTAPVPTALPDAAPAPTRPTPVAAAPAPAASSGLASGAAPTATARPDVPPAASRPASVASAAAPAA
ncbi:hypothetical protein [Kitasatospora sp. NPDC088346]|uniref:hypothetical protein n=1 Tax=Kitasatospora sp. NPDC088346 TaxID=3364073 RepID=UPI00380D3C93